MRQRDFEIVSKEQFIADCFGDNCTFQMEQSEAEEAHSKISIPRRATKRSSGYDFVSPFSFELRPNESVKFPLGIKSYMMEDEELLIFPRSSVGFKFKIKIDNTIGKIDSDYYNNENNEGDIHISVTNTGKKHWTVKARDKICQGSFYNYLITDTDNPVEEERKGGMGSSDGR
jgi:dUTP pyrophosphatase